MDTLIKNIYCIETGERTGQFFVIVDFDHNKKIYSILALPESEILYITEEVIQSSISHKLLKFIEKLPEDIYNDCKNEFLYRIKAK